MLTPDALSELAQRLLDTGFASFSDERGRRVVIGYSPCVGLEAKDFFLSYEGQGMVFFDAKRPMNKYRVAEAGFSLLLAPVVAGIINGLAAAVRQQADKQAVSAD